MQIPQTLMTCIKFFISLALLAASTSAAAQTNAAPHICVAKNAAEVSTKVASAAALANLSNLKGSLKHELNDLISAGLEKLTPGSAEFLAINVTPNVFKSSYQGKESCQNLLAETSATPLSYKNKTFSSKDKLVDWFYRFSQGKGTEGEDLYKRCPGLCSPQYTTAIKSQNNELLLDVFVVCGHARDKWENSYILKSYLSTSCS